MYIFVNTNIVRGLFLNKGKYFSFKCIAILRIQILSVLQITNASYSRILHWFIHVEDNLNVKTNLICNESQFQQTNRVKTQMHCFICKDRQVSHLMDFVLH